MRKANSSAIGLLAFVLMLSLVFPAAALSSPGDPLTWRDSTWDYRSEDSADIGSERNIAKSLSRHDDERPVNAGSERFSVYIIINLCFVCVKDLEQDGVQYE